ncbi:hypothetical protein [Arcticibacter tournemirensis]
MKKKITRKNFSSIKTINLLLDEEASKIRGGTVYVDYDGNIIGKVGNSNELRFTDMSITDLRQSGREDIGLYFNDSSLDERVRSAFINKFSRNNGINYYETPNTSPQWMAQLNLDKGTLDFSMDSCYWTNFYNLLSVIDHENFHYDHHYGGTFTEDQRNQLEQTALIYQMSQENFKNSDSGFQDLFRQDLADRLRMSGFNEETIRSMFENLGFPLPGSMVDDTGNGYYGSGNFGAYNDYDQYWY